MPSQIINISIAQLPAFSRLCQLMLDQRKQIRATFFRLSWRYFQELFTKTKVTTINGLSETEQTVHEN